MAKLLDKVVVELWELHAAAALEGITVAGRLAAALERLPGFAADEVAKAIAKVDDPNPQHSDEMLRRATSPFSESFPNQIFGYDFACPGSTVVATLYVQNCQDMPTRRLMVHLQSDNENALQPFVGTEARINGEPLKFEWSANGNEVTGYWTPVTDGSGTISMIDHIGRRWKPIT
jgi:hypothetical protein